MSEPICCGPGFWFSPFLVFHSFTVLPFIKKSRNNFNPMMINQSHNPHNSRRMLPPGNTRKRKHSEADKLDKPIPSNRLLAGYLAHEFLTKGTLLGQKFDQRKQNRIETDSDFVVGLTEQQRQSQLYSRAEASDDALTRAEGRKEHETYGKVASILKTNGTHIKGIVNPTQLSRWIHKSW